MLDFHIQFLDQGKSHGQVCITVRAGKDEMVGYSFPIGKAEKIEDNKITYITSSTVLSIAFFSFCCVS